MKEWFAYLWQFLADACTREGFARRVLRLPELASTNGKAVDDLMVYVHWLMLVLFVGWSLYFVYVLWRFSAARHPKADYEGSKSKLPKYSEIGVVLVEAVLLVGIAIPLWAKNVDNFPKPEESTVVQIMAQQFAWNARYPGTNGVFGRQDMKLISNDNVFGVDPADPAGQDDVQVFNEIHVVVNKPVLIYLSSKDVIHSLKLVAMRITQDASPGLRIPCTFTPTKEGRYQIECAQLCGNGHAAMAGGFIVVQSQAGFDAWLKSKSGTSTPQSFE
jgi:cytochrome c oxidase subunit 2